MRIFMHFGHILDTTAFFNENYYNWSTEGKKTSGKKKPWYEEKSTLNIENDEIVSQKKSGVFPLDLPKPKQTWNNIMKVIQTHWCHSGSFFVYVLTIVRIERIPWE